MPAATRELRRRIRSVSSTRKVTKAMELVASSKMRKAIQAVLATRAYASAAWDLLLNLSERLEAGTHPLLRRSQGGRVGVVLVSSNRGLVGGFNTQLVSAAAAAVRSLRGQGQTEIEAILLGRKGQSLVSKHDVPAAAAFEKLDVVTSEIEVRPVAKLVIDDYRSGRYSQILLAYTDFHSMLLQKPRVRRLLPLTRDFELGSIGETVANGHGDSSLEYLFEPDPEAVLDRLLPRLVAMQLYQAVLESTASEHAARMMAMRNASDAASDLIDDLTLTFNQARQAGITQDLAEISSSRAALEA